MTQSTLLPLLRSPPADIVLFIDLARAGSSAVRGPPRRRRFSRQTRIPVAACTSVPYTRPGTSRHRVCGLRTLTHTHTQHGLRRRHRHTDDSGPSTNQNARSGITPPSILRSRHFLPRTPPPSDYSAVPKRFFSHSLTRSRPTAPHSFFFGSRIPGAFTSLLLLRRTAGHATFVCSPPRGQLFHHSYRGIVHQQQPAVFFRFSRNDDRPLPLGDIFVGSEEKF